MRDFLFGFAIGLLLLVYFALVIAISGCGIPTNSNYHWTNDSTGGHGTTSWEIRK